MENSYGGPSSRVLTADVIGNDYTVIHDYYNHRDAEKYLNLFFPISRLGDMTEAGCIGKIAQRHISPFMRHIDGFHVRTLKNKRSPEAADILERG